MNMTPLVSPLVGIVFAPLALGVINRTKALFAGRKGAPLCQLYFDLFKLLRKGAAYSRTTSWVFRAGPVVGLACLLTATAVVPFGGLATPIRFEGDLVLLVYLLGLMRFFTVIAALDTGSAFEGMGASREVQFAALAEPAFLLGLAAVARQTGSASLSGMMNALTPNTWVEAGPAMAVLVAALLVVFLAENARIPVDDPNTHLELTMIHEVMVLDHGGPDLALILYSAALKLWIVGSVLVGIALPVHTGLWTADVGVSLAGMLGLCVAVGTIESVMARLRLLRVPQLLVSASALSLLALILTLRHHYA